MGVSWRLVSTKIRNMLEVQIELDDYESNIGEKGFCNRWEKG